MTASNRKTVFVTGASAGIGLTICERLLGEGYTVLAAARRRCAIKHERLFPIEVDLMDPKATQEAARAACEQHQVTNIVHNAGVIRPALLADVKLEDLQALVNLHLSASLLLVQAALPTMRAARYGRIVLIGTRAMQGMHQRTVYAGTKAGMVGMARTWALELAGEGITSNVIAPGPVHSEMFDAISMPGSDMALRLAKQIPVGRIGRPEDVAHAVKFFLSPESDFITGQVLYVCGGASLGGLTL